MMRITLYMAVWVLIAQTAFGQVKTCQWHPLLPELNMMDSILTSGGKLSESYQKLLFAIASECPERGGELVFRARSLYELLSREEWSDQCTIVPKNQSNTIKRSVDSLCYGADTITFINPIMQGVVGVATSAPGWQVCQQTPDVQPDTFLKRFAPANSDSAFAGMVAAYDFGESIGQFLDTMYQGKNYCFSFDLAAFKYDSMYVNGYGGKLQIWLGQTACDTGQLIYVSPQADTVWRTYKVCFTPDNDYVFMMFRADTISNTSVSNYILLDNFSSVGCLDTATATLPIAAAQEGLVISPNPNPGQFRLQWELQSSAEDGQLRIYDVLGRMVHQRSILMTDKQAVLDLQQLFPGYYRLVLETAGREILYGNLMIVK